MRALEPGLRRVNRVMKAAANSGISKMRSARISMLLVFHGGEILDMGCLAFAIKSHDERQADSNFGGPHGNNKEDHDLAVEIVVEGGQGHKREVCRVQHQLQGHVGYDSIAGDTAP